MEYKITEKLELVKEFNKYHPGLGTEWGYSIYVGGMTDTGHWLFEKLISEPEEILKVRLDILKRQQEKTDELNKQSLKEYDRVESLPEKERKEYYIEERKKIDQEITDFFRKQEIALMWGSNKK